MLVKPEPSKEFSDAREGAHTKPGQVVRLYPSKHHFSTSVALSS